MDEVSFVAPDLGPLAALLVAPQAGSWVCDEVDVSSSRTNHTDRSVWPLCSAAAWAWGTRVPLALSLRAAAAVAGRRRFVCRARLGGRKGEPAAYLTPVPPGAVVYGTGDAARVVTKVRRALTAPARAA